MRFLTFVVLLPLALVPVGAKDLKLHGYVTAVHSSTSFDLDDYKILRDQSVTIDFDSDDDDEKNTDYPRDIRIGSEIEIRGAYDEATHELKAKSVKVFTRESRRLKRTAILTQVPDLHKNGQTWEGAFRADGQTIVVDASTDVAIVPNNSQKKVAKKAARDSKKAKDGSDAETPDQALLRLDEVHTGMYVAYEGIRSLEGHVRATKLQFRDNEKTAAEVRLWKALSPRVSAFKGTRPGELKLGPSGKFKLTPSEEVQSYVRKLGESLIPESQRSLAPGDPNKIPFQFYVGEAREPNAFATANGVIVVQAPMLAIADCEAQLASVLAHEIAHATQEHTLRQLEFHKKKRMLLAIGASVAAAYGAYNVRDLLNLTAAAITNGYQRFLENQADRVGMEYMIAAGYDPREAPRMWQAMALKTGDRSTSFFWSNHDNHATRRSYLMSELKMNYSDSDFGSLRSDSPDFARVRGVLAGIYGDKKRIKVKF